MMFWIISSSALLLVLIGLRRVLRGRISPRLQYALWLLALLRLLIPGTAVSSALSLANLTERTQAARDLDTLDGVDLLFYREESGTVEGWYEGRHYGDAAVVLAEDTTWEEYSRLDQTRHWRDALQGIWIAGMAVTGAALLGCNLSFSGRLRRSRREIDVKGSILPVFVCAGLKTPCLFGLLRPAIYIMPEVAEDEVKLRHVLAHETTHYRHGDFIWSALRGVCLALHWYNPLVWRAAALSRRDAELCCDAGAIRRLGEDERADYGRTLIGLSVKKPGGFDLLCCATTMTGGKTALKERVTAIAKNPKTKRLALIVVVAAVAVAAVCLFTGPRKMFLSDADAAAVTTPEPTVTPGPTETPAVLFSADLDHDGQDDERISVTGTLGSAPQSMATVSILDSDGGEPLAVWSLELNTAHAGWGSVFHCVLEGEDYVLYYAPHLSTGAGWYTYTLADAHGVFRENSVRFSMTPNEVDLDAGAMTAFADEINALLEHSILLASTQNGEAVTGPASAAPYYESYDFMDAELGTDETLPLQEKIERYEAYLREQWQDVNEIVLENVEVQPDGRVEVDPETPQPTPGDGAPPMEAEIDDTGAPLTEPEDVTPVWAESDEAAAQAMAMRANRFWGGFLPQPVGLITSTATLNPAETENQRINYGSEDIYVFDIVAEAHDRETGEIVYTAMKRMVIGSTEGSDTGFRVLSQEEFPVEYLIEIPAVESVEISTFSGQGGSLVPIEDLTLQVGDYFVLNFILQPEEAALTAETRWSSSDETVCTVELGQVTAVGPGECIITAEAGGVTDTCTVRVK